MNSKTINEYIMRQLQNPKTMQIALNNFDIIDDFFYQNPLLLNIDLAIELINSNQLIRDSLVKIYHKYAETILTRSFNNQIFNDSLVCFMEAYYIINDAKIEETKEDHTSLALHHSLYYREIRNFPILSQEELMTLYDKYLNGNKKAKDKIISSNLRLVVQCARPFFHLFDPMDLIQEGNLGLIEAIDRFDITKGIYLSTFLSCSIKFKIMSFMNRNQSYFHINDRKQSLLRQIKMKRNAYLKQTGKEPTFDELLKLTNISEQELGTLLRSEKENFVDCDMNEVSENDSLTNVPYSHDLVEEAIKAVVRDELIALLDEANLTPKQKEILLLNSGFINDYPYQLKEIAKMYKNSEQAVSISKQKALQKIRDYQGTQQFALHIFNSN